MHELYLSQYLRTNNQVDLGSVTKLPATGKSYVKRHTLNNFERSIEVDRQDSSQIHFPISSRNSIMYFSYQTEGDPKTFLPGKPHETFSETLICAPSCGFSYA